MSLHRIVVVLLKSIIWFGIFASEYFSCVERKGLSRAAGIAGARRKGAGLGAVQMPVHCVPPPGGDRAAPAHCQVQCQGHARASAAARRNAGAAAGRGSAVSASPATALHTAHEQRPHAKRPRKTNDSASSPRSARDPLIDTCGVPVAGELDVSL
ncbi:unnamed protein product, partial [Iphiclides podalirius]